MLQLFGNAVGAVLLIGLLVGAGLPAIFAVGIKAMAYGVGGDAETSLAPGHPVGRVLGILCFAVVAVVIGLGLAIIVSSGFGYRVEFEHLVPTFVKK